MAKPHVAYGTPIVKPWAQFHAYVLGFIIGIRWGKFTSTSGMGHDGMYKIVREYLVYATDDEWKKKGILDAMRFKSGPSIKDDTRRVFRSLFPRNRKALTFGVPIELTDENVSFDQQRIESWKERVQEIKKEVTMSENATQEAAEEQDSGTDNAGNNRVTVNFLIPPGTNPADLTMDNYREVTGKRFRMTKDQAKVRGLSREQAFDESKALAISQLGDK
ncbi:MAG: hypothetical protein V3T23_03075 [Nitrososphaerales archaeon]